MADILPPAPIDAPFASYNWTDWYKKVRDAINNAGTITWTGIDFSGSNLTDIQTRNHNDLQNIQGGSATERYHLTQAEHDSIVGSAGWTYIKLTSDFSTNSASPFDVTSLGFAPVAGQTYIVEGMLLVQTSDITIGVKPGIKWPTGLNDGAAKVEVTISSTTSAIANLNYGANGAAAGTDLPAINTSYPAFINSTFTTSGAPSGNFQITLARE